jgi:hypothetical protein
MATSVKIATPIPTKDQVARRLGISGERKRAISNLAEETVGRYYQRAGKSSSAAKTLTSKKQKAA